MMSRRQTITFGGVGYVYGIDCSDGFMGIYLLQTHQVVYTKYVQLIIIIPQ